MSSSCLDTSLDRDITLTTEVSVDTNRVDIDVSGAARIVDTSGVIELTPTTTKAKLLSIDVGVSTEVDVEAPSISTTLGVQGPAGKDGTPGSEGTYVAGLDTSAVTEGRLVRVSGPDAVVHADQASEEGAFSLGCFDGFSGRVLARGAALVEFETSSPTPQPHNRVFLGADGKATVQVASTGFVSWVGEVLSVPAGYASDKKARVFVNIHPPIKRAT